jgi:hypothetical protein
LDKPKEGQGDGREMVDDGNRLAGAIGLNSDTCVVMVQAQNTTKTHGGLAIPAALSFPLGSDACLKRRRVIWRFSNSYTAFR